MDLRCWMARASRALATIGANIGLPEKEVGGLSFFSSCVHVCCGHWPTTGAELGLLEDEVILKLKAEVLSDSNLLNALHVAQSLSFAFYTLLYSALHMAPFALHLDQAPPQLIECASTTAGGALCCHCGFPGRLQLPQRPPPRPSQRAVP